MLKREKSTSVVHSSSSKAGVETGIGDGYVRVGCGIWKWGLGYSTSAMPVSEVLKSLRVSCVEVRKPC